MRATGSVPSAAAGAAAAALDGRPDIDIPRDFLCPIAGTLMRFPVIAADGHSYERTAITKWLKDHGTSPSTNLPLVHRRLVSNHNLRGAIDSFVTKSLASPPVVVASQAPLLTTPVVIVPAPPAAASIVQQHTTGIFARIFRALFASTFV